MPRTNTHTTTRSPDDPVGLASGAADPIAGSAANSAADPAAGPASDPAGAPGPATWRRLAGRTARYRPGGHLVFRAPATGNAGDTDGEGEQSERERTLTVAQALPVLIGCRPEHASLSVLGWRSAALHALGLTPAGAAGAAPHLDRIAELTGQSPDDVLEFVRHVALVRPTGIPTWPRGPATDDAPPGAGSKPAAARQGGSPHPHRTGKRVPPPVTVSLRLDAPADTSDPAPCPDGAAEPEDLPGPGSPRPGGAPARLVVQAHRADDPSLLVDVREVAGQVCRALCAGARVWPPLAALGAGAPVRDLSDDEVGDLLGGTAARLARDAGLTVHVPRDLVGRVAVRARVETSSRAATFRDLLHGGDAPELRWRLSLDGRDLTDAEQAELAELADARRPFVRLRDHWVAVGQIPVRAREAPVRIAAADAVAAVLTGTAGTQANDLANDLAEDGISYRVPVVAAGGLARLRDRLLARPAPVPAPALATALRPHQEQGLAWLAHVTELGLGACLADDMGLGKTVTVVALHLHRQRDDATAGPMLVVCPASLLGAWERELARHAPSLPVHRYHGPGRELGDAAGARVVLTTYGTARRDAARLAAANWSLVVADEAQHLKNPRGTTARAMRRIGAAARVALTGTPLENDLMDLWAVLDWATPGLLGPPAAFRARFGADAQALGRLVAPFLLRRRKDDPGIAPELPPKREKDHVVALTREQAALYEAVVRESLAGIRGRTGRERRGRVLRLLTRLSQICDHPALFLGQAPGTCVTAGRSGKLDRLDTIVERAHEAGEPVLVFTRHARMAALLGAHLAAAGTPARVLDGSVPVARRDAMVRAFQEGRVPVFVLSLRAAGTGLTLTRAEHVVHYDRWWNPAVEAQATDRAHRIGQTRPVRVHLLTCTGTVEERVARMLRRKSDLAEAVLCAAARARLADLGDRELAELVGLAEFAEPAEPAEAANPVGPAGPTG